MLFQANMAAVHKGVLDDSIFVKFLLLLHIKRMQISTVLAILLPNRNILNFKQEQVGKSVNKLVILVMKVYAICC